MTSGIAVAVGVGSPERMASITQKRRQPQPSGMEKALGMLPFGKKAAPARSGRGGGAGKAAMLTAAAGYAYKNRAKLSAMLNKRRGSGGPAQPR